MVKVSTSLCKTKPLRGGTKAGHKVIIPYIDGIGALITRAALPSVASPLADRIHSYLQRGQDTEDTAIAWPF